MSRNKGPLEQAYKLIREFKEGRFEPGAEIPDDALLLLQVLVTDLLPGVAWNEGDAGALLLRVAEENSRWNRRTGDTINDIYSARASGRPGEADSLRDDFLRRCPSVWYCEIVAQC